MIDDTPADPFEGLDLPPFLEGETVLLPPDDGPRIFGLPRWQFGLYFDPWGKPFDVPADDDVANVIAVDEIRQSDLDRFMLATSLTWHGFDMIVHTSYLGLNHQYFYGPPLVWETMAFGEPFGWSDLQVRYATEGAARAGHLAVVGALKAHGLVLVEEGVQ